VSGTPRWWANSRGEGYVVLQAVLFALILIGPSDWPGFAWPEPLRAASEGLGWILMAAGFVVAVIAARHLGPNLTPLPRPRDEAHLVVSGLYRIVRHPIYFGVLLLAGGWALYRHGTLTLVYVAVLGVFFDLKSRREEGWLVERFPEYSDYQRRVRKLIPWVY